jgi:hypothetical protein
VQDKVHPHSYTPVVEIHHHSQQVDWHAAFLEVNVPFLFNALASWSRQLLLKPVPVVKVSFEGFVPFEVFVCNFFHFNYY